MKITKSRITAIFFGLALILVLIFVLYQQFFRDHYTFFYPDYQFKKLHKEERIIPQINKNKLPIEILLVREYILGPIHYDFRLTLNEGVSLVNLWLTQTNQTDLILNFNSGFREFAASKNEDCQWFLDGLINTLKKNTRINKLFILVENNSIHSTIGKWNIFYPIIINK